MDTIFKRLTAMEDYHRPTFCEKCNGVMVYKGLGEFQCEECEAFAYDDYGKVRNYLDKHRGANVAEISAATGVSNKTIRDMIKENRFEVIESPTGYLRCEMCGIEIKSGRLCSKCEKEYHHKIEAEARAHKKNHIAGGSAMMSEEHGKKRFSRDDR